MFGASLFGTYAISRNIRCKEYVLVFPLLWIEANRASGAGFDSLGVCRSRCLLYSRLFSVVKSEPVSSEEEDAYDDQT